MSLSDKPVTRMTFHDWLLIADSVNGLITPHPAPQERGTPASDLLESPELDEATAQVEGEEVVYRELYAEYGLIVYAFRAPNYGLLGYVVKDGVRECLIYPRTSSLAGPITSMNSFGS